MPWKETCAMDQRVQLIGDWLKQEYTIKELSEQYRVSRKTVYKWIGRYEGKGLSALEELSHTPHTHPNATPPEVIDRLINTKLQHKNWGPKKVIAWLQRHHPETRWPVTSTAGSILKKEGLTKERRFRHHTPVYSEPFQGCERPNDVWSIDYKGQFRMGDRRLCYPLTISDNYSRYLLACQGLFHPNYEKTQPWLERAFREYGLPLAMRNDNGAPFASVGLGGISLLSVWLIKLWIRPERIAPGHPEQNGRHERMHRSLKGEAINPSKANIEEQQEAFDNFMEEYNMERPHEALDMEVPASCYVPSRRIFPKKLPDVEYESWFTVRQVRSNGCIKWKGGFVYISEALVGEPVGLRQINDSEWVVRFNFYPLGILDERIGKIAPLINPCSRKVLPIWPV